MTRNSRFPGIAMEFFDQFARFENALKRAGYLKNKDAAEADWDKFARDLDASFFEQVRGAKEAATLVSAPPKKRIRDQGVLSWQDGLQVTDAPSLFVAVCRARNNLFHGEKFIRDREGDKRGEQLLTESLWVLELALAKHAELKTVYDSQNRDE